MVNISSLIQTLDALEGLAITVHQERCVVTRNRNASCRNCADACTSGAIALWDNQLAITADLCIGCGTCATVCPSSALEAHNPSDAELISFACAVARERQATPVFACSPLLADHEDAYDKSLVVEVGCLGRLHESELISLAALGIPAVIFAHTACDACANKQGKATYDLVKTSTNTLLQSWGHDTIVHLEEGLPKYVRLSGARAKASEDVDGLSRRDFLSQIKTGAKTMAADVASSTILAEQQPKGEAKPLIKVMQDGTLPHFIPNRRERLLDHLERLGHPVVDVLDTRLWGQVAIDLALCNSCRMCATFCPTGAIYKFDDTDGSFGVEHYPASCVQCHLCQDICPTDALTLSSAVSLKELVEGAIKRQVMQPVINAGGQPHAILNAMKELLGGGQVYER
ncbi:MAG: 4Fe-4S binding protein [Coriobacteriales bacterium]|jgi:Fe-S-cluster-containing hydrogenase component 2|nr:4Fe-4S binding protein [Coriobacteriales bacterium]